ncbi:MAG TPA: tRNA (N6-isopentenyl adenosine(37)-C2)-methylthiotransferase MiaB [Candidatus Kapabacteria bacterium]|nr:tRNA (N6-isopentenyl adenosine(37)-C2)-methylthiotransferase MiaB [Candidatus Kapabacteria bacterium]
MIDPQTVKLPVVDAEPGTADARAAGVRKVYVETYGCQMNEADSEIVLSVMNGTGYEPTQDIAAADVIFLNTCSIRDNAEQRIHGRLTNISYYKKQRPGLVVGLLGCMAERLRKQLLQEGSVVDVVVGPDQYRALPDLVEEARTGSKGLAVKLSRVETYDDITPLRTEGISAWLSVMRGCDKFCTFCVVPFTRGRERSRSLESIVREVEELSRHNFREVTLLGQNVNSYRSGGDDFADLLAAVAAVDPSIRIRYTTSHPQDMSDKLIETMAAWKNICNYIHLPVQSGSNRVLKLMNRTYTVEHYLERVARIQELIPDASLSTDIIAGFPTETEEDHRRTLDLIARVGYDGAYMFKYSPRENTKAWAMGDDVPEEVKGRRLAEIIDLQREIAHRNNQRHVGTVEEILVDGPSKRDEREWKGRTDTNKVVVFTRSDQQIGDYVPVMIQRASAATLHGAPLDREGRPSYIPLQMAANPV